MLNFNQSLLTELLNHDQKKISVMVYDTLNSTNETLWEFINQGLNQETVIIALQQTKGKGQWGRKWESQPGGLYLSMALFPDITIEDAAHITIFTVWGIVKIFRDHGVPVSIKWLNDLILNGQKLGGILTETRSQSGNINKMVIGVGINWQNSVPETGINLTLYPQISLEQLAAIAIHGILLGYTQYQQLGIENILKLYLQLIYNCLLYTSPSPRDLSTSRMPSSA